MKHPLTSSAVRTDNYETCSIPNGHSKPFSINILFYLLLYLSIRYIHKTIYLEWDWRERCWPVNHIILHSTTILLPPRVQLLLKYYLNIIGQILWVKYSILKLKIIFVLKSNSRKFKRQGIKYNLK